MDYLSLVKEALLFATNNQGSFDEDFREHPREFYDTLNDLIDNGYIKGNITQYKPMFSYSSGRIFDIEYVTISGKQTIDALNKSSLDKVKEYVKANGVPCNLKEVSKLVANILF